MNNFKFNCAIFKDSNVYNSRMIYQCIKERRVVEVYGHPPYSMVTHDRERDRVSSRGNIVETVCGQTRAKQSSSRYFFFSSFLFFFFSRWPVAKVISTGLYVW